jgi:hypothetical protein
VTSTSLSAGARSLLGIPLDAQLPTGLPGLYDRWFAGRRYETRFGEGWSFGPRGQPLGLDTPRDLDCCLEHRTAQFDFGLDEKMGVHVLCRDWVQIASSFTKLVEADSILVASRGIRRERQPLGNYASFDDFLAANRSLLTGFREISLDPGFHIAFVGEKSAVLAGRFYTDEYSIWACEYL